MRKNIIWISGGFLLGILATAYCMQQWMVYAQQTERPGNSLDNPIDVPRASLNLTDPALRSIDLRAEFLL